MPAPSASPSAASGSGDLPHPPPSVITDADGGFVFDALPATRTMIQCGADAPTSAMGAAFLEVVTGREVERTVVLRR